MTFSTLDLSIGTRATALQIGGQPASIPLQNTNPLRRAWSATSPPTWRRAAHCRGTIITIDLATSAGLSQAAIALLARDPDRSVARRR
jgi:hypothetical protein